MTAPSWRLIPRRLSAPNLTAKLLSFRTKKRGSPSPDFTAIAASKCCSRKKRGGHFRSRTVSGCRGCSNRWLRRIFQHTVVQAVECQFETVGDSQLVIHFTQIILYHLL